MLAKATLALQRAPSDHKG